MTDRKPKGGGRKKINANIKVDKPKKMKTKKIDRTKGKKKSVKGTKTYMKTNLPKGKKKRAKSK